MALVFVDRVRETSTSTGTGTISVAGAVANFRGLVAGVGTGNQTYYTIVHQTLAEWEVGIGTVTDATPDTLSRTTVLASSNAGALVNFSAGTKDVFVTLPAAKVALLDLAQTFTALQTFAAGLNVTAGNVNIGTAGSSVPLHALGHVNREVARFQASADTSNNRAFISLYATNPSYWWELSNQDSSGGGTTNGLAFRERSASDPSTARLYLATGGGIGVGTMTPGAVGAAKLQLHGTDASPQGPHLQLTTTVDSYPLLQVLGYVHNHVSLNFDAYWDGSWRSSYSGSNFQIGKIGDQLQFNYESGGGVAPGNTLTWTTGLVMTNLGAVGIGMTPTVQFELSGSVGQKASGTTWSNPSDERLKEHVRDYTDGLDVLRKVRPVHYMLNGLAGTPKGQRGISVIAQEMAEAMPYTIETYRAKLRPGDTDETELYRFEASAVTFALVNAVKELDARVQAMERKRGTA